MPDTIDSPATVPLSAFVPVSLRAALVAKAREHDRSVSAELREALRAHLSDVPLSSEPTPAPSDAGEHFGRRGTS